MAFKRVHHRAKFDSNLSVSDIEDFVDGIFNDASGDGISGLIIEIGGAGTFILEGEDTDVDTVVGKLNNASELYDNETYKTHSGGTAFYSKLASHIDGDARDIT